MSDPNDLAAFLDHGWQRLSRGVADRRAAARHPVFATVSPDGFPEVRTVVLRAADRAAGFVEIHTDGGSSKVASLAAHPFAQLHIWDEKAKLQLRLSTRVEMQSGGVVAHKWQRIPDGSRTSYGVSPAPGTPIPNAYAYEKQARFESFTVLICHLEEIELMHLGDIHRRAVFKGDDGWAGTWVVP